MGEGFHQRLGGPHAEREALAAAGEGARGATAYVSLEPCCHQGRTPPCADALVEAGIARVVACHRDPNPQVAGGGFRRLEEAGIEVEHGVLSREAVRLNLPFVLSQVLGRPAVTLKWAMSLDGRIATVGGESQWISGDEGRRWGMSLREEHGAILVGSGTVLADDPSLNRRQGLAEGPILRAVLDRRLRTPPGARMLSLPGPVVVYTVSPAAKAARKAWAALEEAGAELVVAGEEGAALDLERVLGDLHRRGVQSLLVEGGGEVHASFVASGLYDRVAVDCAPLVVGGDRAPGPVRGQGFERLDEAHRLEDLRATAKGGDVILEGWRVGCLQDLCEKLDA